MAARVLRVSEGGALRGPLVAGRAGDFLLENGLVAVVVEGLDGEHPGALVDAARADRRDDALRFLQPVLGTSTCGRPALERVRGEELGGAATLTLAGHDAELPELAVTIAYSLAPGRREIRIATRVENRGARAVPELQLGDLLDLGAAGPFAPGGGRALPESASTSAPVYLEWPWLAGWDDRVSYLYRAHHGPVRIAGAGAGLRSLLRVVHLAPGASASVSRSLAIGEGGGLQGIALPAATAPRGELEVSATADGEPLPHAEIVVRKGRGLRAVARGDRDGVARLLLEPGRYALRALAPDREGHDQTAFVEAGRTSAIRLEAGPPSSLVHDLRDEHGAAIPVTIALARDGDPPWRGERARETAPPRTLLVPGGGRGTVPLPPGRYRVTIDAGPLRAIHSEAATLAPRAGASVGARLPRIAAPSLFALDLGQRSIGSAGCSAPAAERLAASLAAGLDGIVLAEGERLARWSPAPARLLLVPADALAGLELVHLIDHRPERIEERLGRWLATLAEGRRPVAVGGSAACGLGRPGGFPRTYLELEGARATPAAIADALRAGRAIASNGPLLELRVEGKGPGATVHARPAPGRGRPRGGLVSVRLQVFAPAWIALDELQLYRDGKPWGSALPIPGRADGTRLDRTLELPLDQPGAVSAVVRGPVGGLGPIAPEARPLAVANPVRVSPPR